MESLISICDKLGIKQPSERVVNTKLDRSTIMLANKTAECIEKVTVSVDLNKGNITQLASNISKVESSTLLCDEKCEEMGHTVSKVYDIVEETDGKYNRLQIANEALVERVVEIERSIVKSNFEARQLGSKVQDIDQQLRRRRIIITNFDTRHDVDLRGSIFKLLSQLHTELEYYELDVVTRLGNRRPEERNWRPILVSFLYEETRNEILRAKRKLSSQQLKVQYPRVWVNEDVNEEVRRGITDMQKIQRKARNMPEFRETFIRGHTLVVNGHAYKCDQLGNLPEKLMIKNVTTEIGENYVAFAGQYAQLSNMYQCRLMYRGNIFSSSEQMYAWIKADYAKMAALKQAIVNEHNPFYCKKMVRNIRVPGWNEVESGIMRTCLIQKFTSSDVLKKALKETGTKKLIEATRGLYWGAGVTIGSNQKGTPASKVFQEQSWEGSNKLGQMLEEVREQLFPQLKATAVKQNNHQGVKSTMMTNADRKEVTIGRDVINENRRDMDSIPINSSVAGGSSLQKQQEKNESEEVVMINTTKKNEEAEVDVNIAGANSTNDGGLDTAAAESNIELGHWTDVTRTSGDDDTEQNGDRLKETESTRRDSLRGTQYMQGRAEAFMNMSV